jgi:pimeloyl-ACP methyl ester carboxylesterase
MLPEGIEYFAGDLPEEEQQLVWATASPPAATLFGAKIESPAWRDKPCWNIVGTNDQAVHPDLERAAAKRMNGKITEVASSHVPMLSHPDVVLKVIQDACSSL